MRADLAEPWSRYLSPPSAKTETSKTSETDQVSHLHAVPVADVLDVADLSGEERAIDPDGWTFQLEGGIE
jgi:hypothetical protein